MNRSLTYVDETNTIIATHNDGDAEADEAGPAASGGDDLESSSDSDNENTSSVSSEVVTTKTLPESILLPHAPDPNTVQSDQNPCRAPDQVSNAWLSPSASHSSSKQKLSVVERGQTSPEWSLHEPWAEVMIDTSIDAQLQISGSPVQVFPARDQALLLKYFIQELSAWFDLCDPDRHFSQVVPQRARTSQTLLNAICTMSARHLIYLQNQKDIDNLPAGNELLLPRLEQDTILEYQNECIRDLLRFSVDPDQIQNVDLLAASIILRTDEEIDASFHEGQTTKEVFLRVTSAFIEAQAPQTAAIPHSTPRPSSILASTSPTGLPARGHAMVQPIYLDDGPPISPAAVDDTASIISSSKDFRADGLRQACFWIALRQELHASFMNQRAFTFPLSKFDSFRELSPAVDAVWADRVIILHADVLEFCFTIMPNISIDPPKWQRLKQQAHLLESSLPISFHPIYFREGNLGHARFFPELLYLDACHVTAAAYTELTRILLATFDPDRPRLGSGYLASHRKVMSISKAACVRLCGMALSNKQAPPVYLNACAAVMQCGEYFEEKADQEALIWFLRAVEDHLAYSTSNLVSKLTKAWGW